MKLTRGSKLNFQVKFQRRLALKLLKSIPEHKLAHVIGLLKNEIQYPEVMPDKFDKALIAEAEHENCKDTSSYISLESLAKDLKIEL